MNIENINVEGFGFIRMTGKFYSWMEGMNYSPDTIASRKQSLKYFTQWCEERGIDSPREVTPKVLDQFRLYLSRYRKADGAPLKISSQQGRLVAVRSFFRFMFKNSYTLYDPASALDLPRSELRIPGSIMTHPEVEKVFNVIDINSPVGIRDRAMLEVLYSTGMRRAELCNLNMRDIDSDRGILIVRLGKGKKDRVIPVGERALLWVEKYVDDVRLHHIIDADVGRLFVTQYGRPIRSKHLTRICREYIAGSGIDKDGACHIFRHSMATLMLEGGADIRYIQEMLGHTNIETTKVYTRVAINQLKAIHTAVHPAARLKRRDNTAQI